MAKHFITICILTTLLLSLAYSVRTVIVYPEGEGDLTIGAQVDATGYTAVRIQGNLYPVFGLEVCQGTVQEINTSLRPYSFTLDNGKVFLLQDLGKFSSDVVKGDAFGIDCFGGQGDFTYVFKHLVDLQIPFNFSMPQNSRVFTSLQYNITSSDTVLDFNDSVLEWRGDGVRGWKRNIAIFSFVGTAVQKLSKVNITISPSFNEGIDFTYVEFPDIASSQFNTSYIRFKTSQNHVMWKGIIDRSPVYSGLFEVLEKWPIVQRDGIEGTRIKVKGNWHWDLDYTGSLSLVEPSFNSGVKNIHIENKMSYNSTDESHSKATTGVGYMLAVDSVAENINGKHLWNPLVTAYACANFYINKGYNEDPLFTEAGRGYFIQIGDCFNCHAKNLVGRKNRHVVDFTGCQNCSAQDCQGIDEQETSFSLHGQWEYDILVKNCTGSVGIAISSTRHWNFGDLAYNVTIQNVTGQKLMNYRKAYNVKIIDCEFVLAHTNDFKFLYENTVVTKYIRFQNISFHESLKTIQVKDAQAVNSTLKCEFYDGPNKSSKCIEEGAIVKLTDCTLDIRPKWYANNPIHKLDMTGGKLIGDSRSISFRGVWVLRNVEFYKTSLVFDNSTVGGSELKLIDCYQKPEGSAKNGIIVNKIPEEGIISPVTGQRTLGSFFTLVVKGGNYEVPEGKHWNTNVFNFGKPNRSLDLWVVKPNILSGRVYADLRDRMNYSGKLLFKLGNIGKNTNIIIKK